MPIDLKTIERQFFDVVRPHPAFAGWKKKARTLTGPASDTQLGIELIRFRNSFENAQLIAVAAFCSIPFPIRPDRTHLAAHDDWAKDRLFWRTYLMPETGMTAQPTFGSGAVVFLHDESEALAWSTSLADDIDAFVLPWLDTCTSVDAVLDAYTSEPDGGLKLHVTLWRHGVQAARTQLLDYLQTWQQQPPLDLLFEWSVEYGLLSEQEAEQLARVQIPKIPPLVAELRNAPMPGHVDA
jgi:hypothetical protein